MKYVLLTPHIILFSTNFLLDCFTKGYGKPTDFIFFESEWGFLSSMASLVFSIKASKNKNKFQSLAVVFHELAVSINIMVVCIFWAGSSPTDSLTPEQRANWMVVFEMYVVHQLPLFSSIALLLIEDIVFLKQDSFILFRAGMIYIVINFFGGIYYDKPVYKVPLIDWKNPLVTFLLGVL